jgi:hypothetical protein
MHIYVRFIKFLAIVTEKLLRTEKISIRGHNFGATMAIQTEFMGAPQYYDDA